MMNQTFDRKYFWAAFFLFFISSSVNAQPQTTQNTITFDNKSGQPALVKLVGPTNKAINVSKDQDQTVNVAAGEYYILVRYGTGPENYTYSRGDIFVVGQTATQYSTINITLHKVIGGNYPSHPILAESFDQARIQSQTETSSASKETTSRTDTLIVRSHPTGLKTYIIPLKEFSPYGWDSPKNLAGETPVEITLKPGEYRVFITNYDVPGYSSREAGGLKFLNDGEIDVRCAARNWVCGGKLYSIIKHHSPGKKAMLTALFYPEDQSLEDFIKTLPHEDLFDLADSRSGYEKIFHRHKIPSKDWDLLLTMLRKTGKTIWYNLDRSDYMYLWFFEINSDATPSLYAVHPAIED